MGEVYRARDGRLQRDVALKVLHAALATPEHVTRLTREARAAGTLNHPNILAVFDVGWEGAAPYVVSELLEGESLRQRLDRGPLPWRKALEYAIRVAQALAAAHDKNIYHRDVKPGNVFITSDGRVKLLDFGLATLARSDASAGVEGSTSSALTQPGVVRGTVGYMAPEQVVGETVDHRADVFALGAVLYEMLTGVRAFQRPSAVETMNAVLKEEPVDALLLNPSLPPAAVAVVRRCLEKNREERFQSARDLAFHLKQIEQSTSGTQAQSRARPAARTRRHLLAAGLVLVALPALGWLAHWIFGSAPTVTFKQLTFQRGRIGGARFASPGIVYSQRVDGDHPNVWLVHSGDPQSRELLTFPDYDLLAARADKLVLSKRPRFLRGRRFVGSLAQARLFGEAPGDRGRVDVEDADFGQSDQLAVAWTTDGGVSSRLEYPLGQKLYEAAGSIHSPRVSRDGRHIAFLMDPHGTGSAGHILVVDHSGQVRLQTQHWDNAHGLAWSPRGNEVWFTAAPDRGNRALRAVDLDGDTRLLLAGTGSLTLYDVAPDGSLLLAREDERMVLRGAAPGKTERDLSVADDSGLASLSPDGKYVLFNDRFGTYRRPTDGAEPISLPLMGAMPDDISRDDKWVLATRSANQLVRQLLNDPSVQEPLPRYDIESYGGARWFPNGDRILFNGKKKGQGRRSYVMDLEGGPLRELTPDDTLALSISKKGDYVAATDPKGISIWGVDDGTSRQVPRGLPEDRPVTWSDDGQTLFVFRRGEMPTFIYRVPIGNGKREPWKPLAPPDLAGVYSIDQLAVTPRGDAYCYSYLRVLSDLYLVSGVR